MALTNFMLSLQCKDCGRSFHGLNLYEKTFPQMMKEAYSKGWVTTCKSRYDGGDGEQRAYCPDCASKHKENRFTFCF